jgi:LysM repeat protein
MEFLKQILTGLLVALTALMIVLGAGITSAAESRLGEHNLISDLADGEAACDVPDDWVAVQAQAGDTLAGLADSAGITVDDLMQANCLQGDIHPQDVIYIPQILSEAPPEPCGPPQDWVFYQVKNGEDLLILAERFSITINSIQRANCLEGGELIGVGEYLYLPNSP